MTQPPDDQYSLIGPDLILLLLSVPSEDPQLQGKLNGITRLEKLLYLAEREKTISKFVREPFSFEAYRFGHYSKQIYDAVELLENADLIAEERVYWGSELDEAEESVAADMEPEGVERRFALTRRGSAVAALLSGRHPSVAEALRDIKEKYGSMQLGRLIRYVYARYPESAEKSEIADRYN